MKKPELLAPAGSFESLYAAIEAGCDAVYLSGYMFGARQFATNFSEEELVKAISLCHLYGVKVYVTVNTLIYEEEVETFLHYIDFLHKNHVDAVLIQDIGMLDLIRQTYPNLEVHASTQMHIHNENGVKFCEQMGIKRVVLAREINLEMIKEIRKTTNLEIEVFVHGALCISYSGQCLMSSLIGGRSGNRGACAGSCRLPYKIMDKKGHRYNDEDYPISTKDLNTLENIGLLIESGIDSLKIEGRMKRPEYVYLIVSLYRKAIDSYMKHHKVEIHDNDIIEMKKIFNRGFTKGFLFQEENDRIVQTYRPNHLGVEIGKVIDYQKGYVTVRLSADLSLQDGIRIMGRDVGCTLIMMYKEHKKITSAQKGDIVSFLLDGNIQKGDIVVKTTDYHQLQEIVAEIKQHSRKVSIDGKVIVRVGKPLTLILRDDKHEVKIAKEVVEQALHYPLTEADVRKQINRLGNTIYQFSSLEVEMDEACYVSNKVLNEIRREAINTLNELRCYSTSYHKATYMRKPPLQKLKRMKTCLIGNQEVYDQICQDHYETIYVEDKDLYESLKEDKRVLLKLPRVIEKHSMIEEPVMISELGSLEVPVKEASDFSLNVVNSYSVALLHCLGVKRVTLSYELTKEQIKRLLSSYQKRYGSLPNVEVIAYSQVEAMVSKFLLPDYYHTKEELYLVDKFGNSYPIEKRHGLTYILDYKRTFFKDYASYYDFGVASVRFQFINKKDYEVFKRM